MDTFPGVGIASGRLKEIGASFSAEEIRIRVPGGLTEPLWNRLYYLVRQVHTQKFQTERLS
jgi:hypothetical protein